MNVKFLTKEEKLIFFLFLFNNQQVSGSYWIYLIPLTAVKNMKRKREVYYCMYLVLSRCFFMPLIYPLFMVS